MRKTLRLSFRVVDLAPSFTAHTGLQVGTHLGGGGRAQEANYYYRDGWFRAHKQQQRHDATSLLYTFSEGGVE